LYPFIVIFIIIIDIIIVIIIAIIIVGKSSFNSLIQLKIMNNESYGGIMEKMISSGKQPDDVFITNALKAFAVSGNILGALHLYKMQVKAEDRRRVYRYQRAISPISSNDNNNDQKFSSSLPPPSKRTVHVIIIVYYSYNHYYYYHVCY